MADLLQDDELREGLRQVLRRYIPDAQVAESLLTLWLLQLAGRAPHLPEDLVAILCRDGWRMLPSSVLARPGDVYLVGEQPEEIGLVWKVSGAGWFLPLPVTDQRRRLTSADFSYLLRCGG